jgi:hypothetical protein
MNVVGKIFTVFILVMSLSFMAFSLMVYAVFPDWRSKVIAKGGLNEQLLAANTEKTEVSKEKEQLETKIVEEKDREVKRLAALENDTKDRLKVRQANQDELVDKEKSMQRIVDTIGSIHNTVKSLFAETGAMRGDTKKIIEERRKVFEQAVRISDDLLNAVTERLRLAKLGRELQSQLAKLLPATNPVVLPNHN